MVERHSKYYTCTSCWKQIKHAGSSVSSDTCGSCARRKWGVRRRGVIPKGFLD